jgi:hypothetical protein
MSQDYFSQIQKAGFPINDQRQIIVLQNGASSPEAKAQIRASATNMGAYLKEMKGTTKPIDMYAVISNPKSKQMPQKIEITPHSLDKDTVVLHAHVAPAKEVKGCDN